MGHWYESPGHDGGQFSVAGWDAIGDGLWRDVEGDGDQSLEDSHLQPFEVDTVTIHYVNPDTGDDFYFTMDGTFADWDDFADAVDDALDHYGVES